MASQSYLIVGSGVFGASTALSLIRRFPHTSVTIIDRDSYSAPIRVAASWDWNKLIRADYSDILYTKLALKAQHLWRTDPLYQRFYHESGAVWISPTPFAVQVLQNFVDLGEDAGLQGYLVEEARGLFGGLVKDADYTGVTNVLVNTTSGCAEAKEALQRTIERAVSLGVCYVTAEAATLVLEESGDQRQCCGVKTTTGESFAADQVILCTGAFTPKLLLESAPESLDFHAGDRLMAAGLTEALEPFNTNRSQELNLMPVVVNENPIDRGFDAGCLPLPHMSALKYWGQTPVRNTIEVPGTGISISTPPLQSDYAQMNVPLALENDVRLACESIFSGKDPNGVLENFRICW